MFDSRECMTREGEPRKSFDTEEEALSHANQLKIKHGYENDPYQCPDCGYWHLCPKNRKIEILSDCGCTDRNGKPKTLYATEKDAEKVRQQREEKNNSLRLEIYECPNGCGYHLTHY